MAKKDKITGQEQRDELEHQAQQHAEEQPEQEQEQEQSEEQNLLNEALANGTVAKLIDDERITEKLSMLITVYTSLLGVLGAEAPATTSALSNLESYVPDKVKKPKKPKKEKEQKFNEGKAVRAIFNNEEISDEAKLAAIKELQGDERISEQLGVAITTYTTLLDIDGIPEQAVISAKDTLVNWGKKGKSKSTTGERGLIQHTAQHIIEFGGTEYPNLSQALRAAGYDNKTLDSEDGTKPASWNTAWSKVTGQFKKADTAEHEGDTFTRRWV